MFEVSPSFMLKYHKLQSTSGKLSLSIITFRHCCIRFYPFVRQPLNRKGCVTIFYGEIECWSLLVLRSFNATICTLYKVSLSQVSPTYAFGKKSWIPVPQIETCSFNMVTCHVRHKWNDIWENYMNSDLEENKVTERGP